MDRQTSNDGDDDIIALLAALASIAPTSEAAVQVLDLLPAGTTDTTDDGQAADATSPPLVGAGRAD